MRADAVQAERTLNLRGLLDDLVRDGRTGQDEVEQLLASPRSKEQLAMHPLAFIASQQLDDEKNIGVLLTMGAMLQWLAEKVDQPYFTIDPLKINVPAVTEAMSFEFAKRHKILAVGVSVDHVLIASSEPYINAWESNLEHVLRRPIKRVLVNPEDLERFTVEFYSLAKSVRGASSDDASKFSGVTNFEQMVELGDLKDPDANDQHIVNIVDWVFQYAFEQRASDIHIEPRREVAHVRFRIDGVLYNVYEFPAQVGTAVTSRL
jgi:general secretion pathway protein E